MSYWTIRKAEVVRAKRLNTLKRGYSRRALINFLRLYDKYSRSKPKHYVILPNTCDIKKALEEPH